MSAAEENDDYILSPPPYKTADAYNTNVINGENKTFLYKNDEKTITIPMGNSMEDVKQLVLDSYNIGRPEQFRTVNKFYCSTADVTQEITTIDELKNCKTTITVYFDEETIHSFGGGAYHNRRKSSSRRRRSAKKRGTRRKQKKRSQRRGSRRSH
jgi:hypothetical protein